MTSIAVDDVRGKTLEIRRELRSANRRRAAVDLHDDVLVAAQAHLAVAVDLDRRDVVEQLAGVRGRGGDVFRAIRVAVGLDRHRRALFGHRDARSSATATCESLMMPTSVTGDAGVIVTSCTSGAKPMKVARSE